MRSAVPFASGIHCYGVKITACEKTENNKKLPSDCWDLSVSLARFLFSRIVKVVRLWIRMGSRNHCFHTATLWKDNVLYSSGIWNCSACRFSTIPARNKRVFEYYFQENPNSVDSSRPTIVRCVWIRQRTRRAPVPQHQSKSRLI